MTGDENAEAIRAAIAARIESEGWTKTKAAKRAAEILNQHPEMQGTGLTFRHRIGNTFEGINLPIMPLPDLLNFTFEPFYLLL
jgi:hypothetical protein